MPKRVVKPILPPLQAPMSDAEMRALAREHPERGAGEVSSFTLRNASGQRIDPATREEVPRGYDFATADNPRDQIVPFKPKLNRRRDGGGA